MQEKKPYLDTKLVQQDIARQLHVSNRTLSRTLGEKANLHFSAFINQFRVEEARLLLRNENLSHLSLEAVAQMAGFNSRAVFYRCFTNMEKMSPAQFRANPRKNY